MSQHAFAFFDDGADKTLVPAIEIDPHAYDHVVVAFSGGKDSVACVLHLIENGIAPELWHHDVDGGPDGDNLFDWPVTRSYVEAFANHVGLKLYHSWREGGIEGEMTKQDDRTKRVVFETPDGRGSAGGTRGAIATRRKFPAQSADLRVRWCSSVVKIDPFSAAMAGQDRFKNKKTLVVTGERRQESSARSRYLEAEPHRSHAPGPRARRHVDHWRPVIDWSEQQVWDIMKRHGIVPHPCYRLGFGRASCMTCIFSSARQAATVRAIAPDNFAKIRFYEDDFNHTIRADMNWSELADSAPPFPIDTAAAKIAMSTTYDEPIFTEDWQLPAGAFGEACGPT